MLLYASLTLLKLISINKQFGKDGCWLTIHTELFIYHSLVIQGDKVTRQFIPIVYLV